MHTRPPLCCSYGDVKRRLAEVAPHFARTDAVEAPLQLGGEFYKVGVGRVGGWWVDGFCMHACVRSNWALCVCVDVSAGCSWAASSRVGVIGRLGRAFCMFCEWCNRVLGWCGGVEWGSLCGGGRQH